MSGVIFYLNFSKQLAYKEIQYEDICKTRWLIVASSFYFGGDWEWSYSIALVLWQDIILFENGVDLMCVV